MAETTPKVGSLTALRLNLRSAVYSRYKALKDKGVREEEARNIASAQAATAPGSRLGISVYRRELDALLAPPKPQQRAPRLPYSTANWRLPE